MLFVKLDNNSLNLNCNEACRLLILNLRNALANDFTNVSFAENKFYKSKIYI